MKPIHDTLIRCCTNTVWIPLGFFGMFLTLNTVEPTDSDASARKTTRPSNFSARREKDNWACQPVSFLNKHGPSDGRVEASAADICSSLNTIQMRSSVPTPLRCVRLIEPTWGPISVDVSGAKIVWQLLLVRISIYSLHSMITESGLRILELFSLFIWLTHFDPRSIWQTAGTWHPDG